MEIKIENDKELKIKITDDWTILIKQIYGKYIRIESDSDLSIYPENTNIISMTGEKEG